MRVSYVDSGGGGERGGKTLDSHANAEKEREREGGGGGRADQPAPLGRDSPFPSRLASVVVTATRTHCKRGGGSKEEAGLFTTLLTGMQGEKKKQGTRPSDPLSLSSAALSVCK